MSLCWAAITVWAVVYLARSSKSVAENGLTTGLTAGATVLGANLGANMKEATKSMNLNEAIVNHGVLTAAGLTVGGVLGAAIRCLKS